jgi:hypothetical protein
MRPDIPLALKKPFAAGDAVINSMFTCRAIVFSAPLLAESTKRTYLAGSRVGAISCTDDDKNQSQICIPCLLMPEPSQKGAQGSSMLWTS